jgi:hypothetical protein
MYLQLVRESFSNKATEGKLFVNGTFECYTLEDTDRFLESGGLKIQNDTCIPRGTYTVKLTRSNRFLKTLPLLLDVPQFTGVRIHSGNNHHDTEGCILVGRRNTTENDDWIGESRLALDELIEKLVLEDEVITLEIV